MILAVDVHYDDRVNRAKAAAVGFDRWDDASLLLAYTTQVAVVAEYQPGEFYRRELPCIMKVLEQVGSLHGVEAIIVDGYVFLDGAGRLGLGAHLYEQLGGRIPIIGVAKTRFHADSTPPNVRLVWRGKSEKALFVTAIGMELSVAAQQIRSMHGNFRIPTVLREVDRISRAPMG